jgi:hypothetical protein
MLEWIFVLVVAGQEVPASAPISIATCQKLQSMTTAQSKCVKVKPTTGGAHDA